MIRSFFSLLTLSALTVAAIAQAPVSAATPAPGPKLSFSSVNPDGPYIALTFDDGPSKANTPRLLDILAKHHVKATFFILGENAKENGEILKREVAEGHEIANHSWSHPNLAKLSDEGIRSQLQQTSDLVLKETGMTPKLMRPPYGSLSETQRKMVHNQLGYKTILWAVDPLDWKKPGSAVVAQRIVSQTRAGDIILAHDIHAGTIDAMQQAIEGLLAKGFKFVTVSELLAMDHPKAKVQPGAAKAPTAAATPEVAKTTAPDSLSTNAAPVTKTAPATAH